MDPVQPFLVLPERSGVVSFGTGFSVCHLSPASRRAEKGGCPQAALHGRCALLRTVPFLPCGLESRAQRKGRILSDLSAPTVPGGRFYHQLLFTTTANRRVPPPRGLFSLLELAAVLLAGGSLFIAARQVGVLGAVAFRYNVLFTPSAVLLVWLLAVGKGVISRLLSTKPFLWLAGLSPYGFLIHQVLIRYMEWTADKFSLTVQPVVWTLTVYLLTLCLSSFYKALERQVLQRHAKTGAQ